MPDTSTLSILGTIKKSLGMPDTYDVFDTDVVMHINSAFSVLNQINVGPEAGFAIYDDSSTWAQFAAPDPRINMVQTFIYLDVKLVFDPPPTGYLVESMTKRKDELLWRLMVLKDPFPPPFAPPVIGDEDGDGWPDYPEIPTNPGNGGGGEIPGDWNEQIEDMVEDEIEEYLQNNPIADGLTHTQSIASSSWSFDHALGRIPVVSVYLNGELVLVDVQATTTHVTIQFPAPTSGVAVLT